MATPEASASVEAPAVSARRRPVPAALSAALSAALVVAVAFVYAQTRTFAFVNLDDQQYVTQNPVVLRGLTRDGVAWALSAFHAANWHPLTWLSHMADVTLFGPDAGAHHLVSAALHAANALLLFALLRRATGATWQSAAAAALFAVHPLHVESVAWVSERKDVLSALLFLLALHGWVSYARRPGPARYLAAAGLFALALLAKPMVVTLPFVLLLLDAWPLRRLAEGKGGRVRSAARLVLEKVPLLALAAASSLVTWLAQSSAGAAASIETIPLGGRLANALVAYALYLGRTIWPAGLAAFYPHPVLAGEGTPAWKAAGAALLLAALTALAVRERARRPWLLFGWLWFVGMLVPVIGLVQVGEQALADRYAYLPLVGIHVAIAWTAAEPLARLRSPALAAVAAAVPLAALAIAAHAQAATWRDSLALHGRALEVTGRNWNAWSGLGDALVDAERPAEAIPAYREALRVRPRLATAWNGLGTAHGQLGAHAEAAAHFEEALRLRPGYADAWYNLGTARGALGDHARAADCFRAAVRLRPEDARAWQNLGIASLMSGDLPGAARALAALGPLDPERARQLDAALRQAAER